MNHREQNTNYFQERSNLNKKIDWDNFNRVRRFSRVLVKNGNLIYTFYKKTQFYDWVF